MLKENIQDISALGGNPVYLLFILLAFIAKLEKEFTILLIALLLAYAITAAIRLFWWTERPDKQRYKNLWQKFDSGSFPSLHAARATILFITLSLFYKNIFATTLFLSAILTVCFARVRLKRHRIIDVIFGVLLGLFAYFVAPQIINLLKLVL